MSNSNEPVQVTASQVVIALADMASKGKYDNVTKEASQQMNAIFEAAAQLINELEAAEKNQLEQAKQDAAAVAIDEVVEGEVI